MKIFRLFLIVLIAIVIGHLSSTIIFAAPSISNITDSGTTPKYEKFEVTFEVSNTTAENFQLPYISTPPPGINPTLYPKHRGISVDAVFTTPTGATFQQPAFIYQVYEPINNNTGYYPAGNKVWKVRFAPHVTGTWSYRLKAQDSSGTSVLTNPVSFTVTNSDNKGFVRVSSADPRYFEFSDGTYFPAIGRHSRTTYDQPGSGDRNDYLQFGQNGITLIRDWMSGFYGSAWLHWRDGRNTYDYYLPRTGLEGYKDSTGKEYLTMVLAEGAWNTSGWYYNCRRQDLSAPHQLAALKPNTTYKITSTYLADGITGPRNAAYPNFGYVVRLGPNGGWKDNCGEPDNAWIARVTAYGGNDSTWTTIEGTWNSGTNTSARLHLALENAVNGKVWIRDISMKEVLSGEALGPELLSEASAEYETYYPERMAYELDQAIEAAKEANLYLKLVVGDKSDMMWWKMENDGTFVTQGEQDVMDGFYGNGRVLDKKRYLWDTYFRYLTARWGYSTNIHSWELTNEGVGQTKHFVLTDEMGKAIKCKAYGINTYTNGKCTYEHPNRHLVSTSFDHSLYPFWLEPEYPNVDYGDVHAYSSSTGWLSGDTLTWYDAAHYHTAYSQDIANSLSGYPINKPVIRGEAGLDINGIQDEPSQIFNDTNGTWLHNFLWTSLHPGGLIELYWWNGALNNGDGPDGSTANGLMEIYQYFYNFIKDIPLNQGDYVNANATLSDTNLRVTGQKNPTTNRAHLWVQNKNHTWKKVVDGTASTGLSGIVTITGFSPNTSLKIEQHQFTTTGIPNIVTTTVSTNGSGSLTLTLPANTQIADVGIKIGDYSSTPPISPTPKPQGDVDNDSDIDFLDLSLLISKFNQVFTAADFNLTGLVDIFDFNTLISNL